MDNTEQKNNPDLKTIHFHHPRIGVFTLKINVQETLSDCRRYLEASTEFFLFTNYQFEIKGKRLSEIDPICSLFPEHEIHLDLVLNPYDIRTAKHHLAKVMQILRMPEIYLYLQYLREQKDNQQLLNKNVQQNEVPSWAHEFSLGAIKPDLSNEFLKLKSESKVVDLLHSISLSGFNPPPVSEQLNGDLFYIHVKTLQPVDIHITASPYGFYVNQSKISYFNPNHSTIHKKTYASLLDLLKNVSENFKQKLTQFLQSQQINQLLKCKMLSLGKYRTIKWLQEPEPEHGWNNRKILSDEHIKVDLLSMKDWNEAFQVIQKLKIEQNRTDVEHQCQLSKIYSEFESAAIEGAICLVDGKISPLNPTDDKKRHIYIYNKIFFSIANETPYDHSQEKGDDATPSSSSVNTDLINISALEGLGIPDLHVLHMIVVAYRGYKVIAQGIIPGILSVDQINCNQYGSLDDGKTIETNPEFEKLMIEVCDKLGLKDDVRVKDGQGEEKRIAGSPDIKGILGTDKRKYILDLLRLSPRDLNYAGSENETCVIRPELIKSFRQMKEEKKESMPKINVNIGTQINFIKDQNYEQEENVLKELADYLKTVAITNLIDFMKKRPSQCLTDNSTISKVFHHWGVNMRYLGQVVNNENVKKQPHIRLFLKRIILVRSLKHLFRIAMRQTNILYLSQTLINLLNAIFGRVPHVTHLEEGQNEEMHEPHSNMGQQKETENHGKKKKKKKNKEVIGDVEDSQSLGLVNTIKIPASKFAIMKPKEIWSEICKIAEARYNYDFDCKSITELDLFKFSFQKIATLRDLCLSVGIVLQMKNYDITEESGMLNDKVMPFTAKNIVNIQAKAKKMKIQPPNLSEREEEVEKMIEKFQVKEAFAKDQTLLEENEKISGDCNQTMVRVYQRRSRILYILGDYKSAAALEELNLNILQLISCPDSALALKSHQNLGIYYIGLGDKDKVMYHEKKSIFLMLMAFGETSPDLLIALVNLAKIYQVHKEYDKAIECYKFGIEYLQKIFGKIHIELSFCYSSLASICYEKADLKMAISYQTQTVGILIQILPETDPRFQDAVKILKTYRQLHQSGINQGINIKQEAPKKVEEEKPKKKNQSKK